MVGLAALFPGRGCCKGHCQTSRLSSLLPLQVPLAQDEAALSLGYAASLEGTLLEDPSLAGMSEYAQSLTEPIQQLDTSYATQRASQELDETTHSDISERPSVEDVESETGSTGALETRSLKDHKGEAKRVPGRPLEQPAPQLWRGNTTEYSQLWGTVQIESGCPARL